MTEPLGARFLKALKAQVDGLKQKALVHLRSAVA